MTKTTRVWPGAIAVCWPKKGCFGVGGFVPLHVPDPLHKENFLIIYIKKKLNTL